MLAVRRELVLVLVQRAEGVERNHGEPYLRRASRQTDPLSRELGETPREECAYTSVTCRAHSPRGEKPHGAGRGLR